nr:MAG TPA: hypothetical protein [Caudoviricetes sp.]
MLRLAAWLGALPRTVGVLWRKVEVGAIVSR